MICRSGTRNLYLNSSLSLDVTVFVIVSLNMFSLDKILMCRILLFFLSLLPFLIYPIVTYSRTVCSRGLLGRVQK